MIAELLSGAITDMIVASGYPGIFLLMAAESAALPVPSEVVLPFAGYGAFLGNFEMITIILVATFGQLFGALAAYYGARLGGRPFVEKYGKYAMLDHGHLETAENWFQKHGSKAVFLSRLLPIIRTFIPLPAGLAKMDARKYALYTFAGSLPWTATLVYAGHRLGPYWSDIFKFFGELDILVIGAIAVALVYFVGKRRKH
ncbi:MAG: DedA family protein [Candidatus Aenigmatarchaeota archaeon]